MVVGDLVKVDFGPYVGRVVETSPKSSFVKVDWGGKVFTMSAVHLEKVPAEEPVVASA